MVNPLNFQNCMLWNLLCSWKRLLVARSLWLKIIWSWLSTVIDTNMLVFLSWVKNAISRKTRHSTLKYGSAESRSLLPIITITWLGLIQLTAKVNDTMVGNTAPTDNVVKHLTQWINIVNNGRRGFSHECYANP